MSGLLCISFTAIFTKWANVPGPVSAVWRMTIAAVVLALPFIRQVRHWTPAARLNISWGIAGGLAFALNLGLLNTALLLTSAATATLLDNTAPLWVGIGALIVFGERLKGRYWAGLALALAGAAVVTGFNPTAGFVPNRGDAIAFGGATFYAVYLLITQRGRRDLDSLSYLWLVVASAGVALTLASLALRLPLFGYSLRTYAAGGRRVLAGRRLAADQLCPGRPAGFDRGDRAAGPAGCDRAALDPPVGRAVDTPAGARGAGRAAGNLPVPETYPLNFQGRLCQVPGTFRKCQALSPRLLRGYPEMERQWMSESANGGQQNANTQYPSSSLQSRLSEFLAAHTTLTLATVGPDGAPAAAAVFYAHDADLNLYFLSEERTQHGQNLLAAPRVAGTIQADGQDWRAIQGMQVRGRAEPAPAGELAHAAAVYGRKYAFVAALLVGASGPGALTGPLAQARFWVLRPAWFRLIDNTVRFGFKETLALGGQEDAAHAA